MRLKLCFNLICLKDKGGSLLSLDKEIQEKRGYIRKSVNVVDLVKRAKFEEKKEKRRTLVIAAATLSAIAVSGFIISL